MVSFCDIPLSQVKEHISKYGAYGIGLTKEWAQKSKLNPVLYIEQNSYLSKSYRNIYYKYVVDSGKNLYEIDDKQKSIIDILRYIKNYQSDLIRGGQVYKNYRFSDEREWRYVLDYEEEAQLIHAINNNYNKDIANKSLENYKLIFEPNDIKYIIIEREDEIPEFLNILKEAKGKTYTYHDIERLMTRIITTEQIIEDF